MAQLNITLNQEEIQQLLTNDRNEAFKKLLQESLNSLLKAESEEQLHVILSRLVDTFFSRISLTMQPPPKPHSTACVLPWEEGRHWQSRSSGCSSS